MAGFPHRHACYLHSRNFQQVNPGVSLKTKSVPSWSCTFRSCSLSDFGSWRDMTWSMKAVASTRTDRTQTRCIISLTTRWWWWSDLTRLGRRLYELGRASWIVRSYRRSTSLRRVSRAYDSSSIYDSPTHVRTSPTYVRTRTRATSISWLAFRHPVVRLFFFLVDDRNNPKKRGQPPRTATTVATGVL